MGKTILKLGGKPVQPFTNKVKAKLFAIKLQKQGYKIKIGSIKAPKKIYLVSGKK